MLRAENYSREELERKKEEAERKARRGEIDPVHEYTFTLISKVCSNPQIIYEDNMFYNGIVKVLSSVLGSNRGIPFR